MATKKSDCDFFIKTIFKIKIGGKLLMVQLLGS